MRDISAWRAAKTSIRSKRGNNGISLDVADRIVSKFPQVDKLWLLTGEGQMFSEERIRGAQIPYYNVDVEQGIAHLEHLEAESNLDRASGGGVRPGDVLYGACDGKRRAARNGACC